MKRVAFVTMIALATGFAAPSRAADPPSPPAQPPTPTPTLKRLPVPGNPDAFFVETRGAGEQPVLMILHARNRDPEADCKKWIEVASPFGWVVCPSGPVANKDSNRSWGKVDEAKMVIDATFDALRAKFGSRVKPAANVLIGFSEGALVAQLVGITDPERWDRWLILAGSDKYWGDRAAEWLLAQRRKISRVVMLTGEHDAILENTLRAGGMVRAAKIPVRVIVRRGLGHDVPADRMIANYQPSLRWLFE